MSFQVTRFNIPKKVPNIQTLTLRRNSHIHKTYHLLPDRYLIILVQGLEVSSNKVGLVRKKSS